MVADNSVMDNTMRGQEGVWAEYEKRVSDTKVRLSQVGRAINRLSLARLGVIVGGAALIFGVVQTESVGGVLVVAMGVVLLFVWLVAQQSKAEQTRRSLQDFLAVNENELS